MPAINVHLFREHDGTVPLLEWLEGLKPPKVVAKCRVLIELLKAAGQDLRRPHADILCEEIHELRARVGRVQYRMLYFFHGQGTAILSHGFIKRGGRSQGNRQGRRAQGTISRKSGIAYARGELTMAKARNKRTRDAVEILHERYFEGKLAMLELLEEERQQTEIAQQIHDLRTAAGLTQRELAARVGTTASVICRLEDADYDRYSLLMLRRIAAALQSRVSVQFVPAEQKPEKVKNPTQRMEQTR